MKENEILRCVFIIINLAGIKDYPSDPYDRLERPRSLLLKDKTLDESTEIVVEDGLAHPPGTRFLHTTTAYQAIGAIAERVTGESWHRIFRQIVATPLRFRNSSYMNYYSTERDGPNPSIAIGVLCAPSDYVAFIRMVMNNGSFHKIGGGKVQILSSEAVVDMLTIQKATQGAGTMDDDIIEYRNRCQMLYRMGLADSFHRDWCQLAFSNLGFGLGVWIGDDTLNTGRKFIHLASKSVNNLATILNWERGKPIFAAGFSFNQPDGTWEIPHFEFFKSVKGLYL